MGHNGKEQSEQRSLEWTMEGWTTAPELSTPWLASLSALWATTSPTKDSNGEGSNYE